MATAPSNLTFSSILPPLLAAALAAAPTAQAPIAPPAGMTGFWAMDGNADDYGPLALHGAVAGAGAFVPGQCLQGFQPGAGGCIAVPDAPALDVRNNFTFEGWVRLDALPSTPSYLLNKGSTAHRSTPYTFGVIGQSGGLPVTPGASVAGTRGPGRLFVTLSDGALEQVLICNTPLPLGTFVHVACVVLPVNTQFQCRIFVNGVQAAMVFVGRLPFAGSEPLQFGGTLGGANLLGVVDEWSLYDRGLSAAELAAIAAAGPAGKQKPVFDTEPPLVTIRQPADGAVVADRLVFVQADVVDDSDTSVASMPAGIAQDLPAGGGSVAGSVLLDGADGEQLIAVAATDGSGNRAANSVTVVLDTAPPRLAVLSPAPGAVVASSPCRFALQVDDLTATSLQVDGVVVQLPAGQSAVAVDLALRDGPNSLSFLAIDAAGNRTTVVHDVVLDLAAPAVAIVQPPDGALFGADRADVAVLARVDDVDATDVQSDPAGVQASLPRGGGLVSGIVALREGLNRIEVRAGDGGGRTGVAAITVNRDSTAPALQFSAPADGMAVRGSIEVLVSAADVAPGSGVAAIELYDGSALLEQAAGDQLRVDLDTRGLADGPHQLRAVARDGAGNVGEVALRLLVDNQPPVLRVLQPLAGLVQGEVPFVVVADDAHSGLTAVVQRVGGQAPSRDGSQQFAAPVPGASLDGSEDTSRWPNGPLQFEVEAEDAAGNVAIAVVEVEVQNLAVADGPALSPRQGARVHGRIDICARSDRADVLRMELLVDGRRIAAGSGRKLQQRFDTASRLDGPMRIAAVVHTLRAGVLVTEHTVQVDNLRVLAVTPMLLSLQTNGRGRGSVLVAGRSAGLLLPLRQHRAELRLPGGSAVAIDGASTLWRGCGDDRLLALGFDRRELVAALRAARATGMLPGNTVRLQLFVDGVELGDARIWLLPERGRCGRR